MSDLFGIVLAAGLGTRMKSNKHKVLHPVCGKPMVEHVISILEGLPFKEKIVVVGHGAEAVKQALGDRAQFVIQEKQLGTGDAVRSTEKVLADREGTTLILCGDTPLLTDATIERLLNHHHETGAFATLLTATAEDATGYGRIVRTGDGTVSHVVEHKDASEQERQILEVNTGTYCFNNKALFEALKEVTNDNQQGEYYLPDVIGILKRKGYGISAYCTPDFSETMGVNDRVALAEAEAVMQQRILERHMRQGVTVLRKHSILVEADVAIGHDSILYPGTVLRGRTVIGSGCSIGPQSEISDSWLGDNVTVKHSVIMDSHIEQGAVVGPFAYLRPGSDIGEEVKIGDFVEIKNAKLGKGSKVSHLAYVGDAEIGEKVNIGCGVITVNYDGVNKHKTIVEDGAFIGSNVNLVAPVKVGKGAYVVAGSTITHDVPDEALAIARERQTNKPGYATKIREKLTKQNQEK